MALASKKSEAVHNRTGGEKAKLKANFDEGHINTFADLADEGVNPEFGALLYQIQQMQEDIDELRRYLTAEVGDGAAGSDGARGAAGSDGARGAAGSNGNNGAAGSNGNDGAAGSNGNDGSDGARGAAGSDGARGSAGSDGARGAAGAAGSDGTTPTMTSLNGKSLPTRAPARGSGALWNNRGNVSIA